MNAPDTRRQLSLFHPVAAHGTCAMCCLCAVYLKDHRTRLNIQKHQQAGMIEHPRAACTYILHCNNPSFGPSSQALLVHVFLHISSSMCDYRFKPERVDDPAGPYKSLAAAQLCKTFCTQWHNLVSKAHSSTSRATHKLL